MTNPILTRATRSLAIGALVFGISAAALPGSASARTGSYEIAQRIDHIAYQVDRLREIRSPYRQDREIDRLQGRLHRLEKLNDRGHGRLTRRNGHAIDALQAQLRRMERRAERRIDDRRDWRRDSRYDRGDSRRDGGYVRFGFRY